MKKKWLLLGSVVAIAMIITAIWFFKPDPSIIGSWDIIDEGFGDSVKPVIEFNEDGTFSIVSSRDAGDFTSQTEGQVPLRFETTIVGTWEIKGDQLHMMYNDHGAKINGESIPVNTLQEGVVKQGILGQLNSYPPYDFKWIGPDEFETHSKGLTRRYTRIIKE